MLGEQEILELKHARREYFLEDLKKQDRKAFFSKKRYVEVNNNRQGRINIDQQHLNIGVKDFYNLIFNEKSNTKARQKLEEKIDQLMMTQEDTSRINHLYICSP